MKNYYFLFLIFCILLFLGLFSIRLDVIDEKISPIWENDVLVELYSTITIRKNMKDNHIYISSNLLENIDSFQNSLSSIPVHLQIDNYTDSPYLLKDIFIVDKSTKEKVQDITYRSLKNQNTLSFVLKKDSFSYDSSKYQLQIELIQ